MKKLALVAFVAALAAPAALGSPAVERDYTAALTGAAEAPGPGAPSGRATASVTIDAATGELCWRITGRRNLGGKPNAAHIHKGRAGRPGAVVIPLGATYRARGCTTAGKALLRAIVAHPGRYYVNVHNAAYPAGAVRGQLMLAY